MNTFKTARRASLAALLALAIPPIAANAAAPRPCEDVLKEMRAAKVAAKLSADDKAKVDALEAKAVERCNADDDRRADGFLDDAMKLMKK
ncbi:hypothetical protein [Rhizobium lusitanum]|uniref:Uncharacterized protein n=1 Tax=Rhizobium lusitanum TaxID=293958 RepID=A0A7X0MBJ3_9HYPH|nr:hypothetical protein [Rhizobium lusitanum]MBB6484569.1 hypothetical protein [Rhizobium lusitanum]